MDERPGISRDLLGIVIATLAGACAGFVLGALLL